MKNLKDKFYIYVEGRHDLLVLERYLINMGYKWGTINEEYTLAKEPNILVNSIKFLIIGAGNEPDIYFGTDMDYLFDFLDNNINEDGTIKYVGLKYTPGMSEIKSYLNNVPSYEPIKLIRE